MTDGAKFLREFRDLVLDASESQLQAMLGLVLGAADMRHYVSHEVAEVVLGLIDEEWPLDVDPFLEVTEDDTPEPLLN